MTTVSYSTNVYNDPAVMSNMLKTIKKEVNDKRPVALNDGEETIGFVIPPEVYEELIELEIDREPYEEAQKRLAKPRTEKGKSLEELMEKYGITQEELDAMEDVEIE